MNRRNLLSGLEKQAGAAATTALLPASVEPAEARPRRVVQVQARAVAHRIHLDGQDVVVDGALSKLLRPEQAKSAAKAMVGLAERLRLAAVREDALWAALLAYEARFGELPEAEAIFRQVLAKGA